MEENNPLGFEKPVEQSFQPKLSEKINFQEQFNELSTPLGKQIQQDFQQRFGDTFTGFRSQARRASSALSSEEFDTQLTPFRSPFMEDLRGGFANQFSEPHRIRESFDRRRERGRPIEVDSGLVGQGNEVTFRDILGSREGESDSELYATFFQFQQTDVVTSALNNDLVNITTQSFDAITDKKNLETRSKLLAPNELAITVGEGKVKGLTFPEASFHPKASARTFKDEKGNERIIASIGSQNPTPALRSQNIESLLVFQGEIQDTENPYVKVAQELKSQVMAMNEKIESYEAVENNIDPNLGYEENLKRLRTRNSQIREDIGALSRTGFTDEGSSQSREATVLFNEQFLSRMEKTLSELSRQSRSFSLQGTTVYLSFGELNALFQSGEHGTSPWIRKHLLNLLDEESNVQVKVLTNIDQLGSDVEGKPSFEEIQQTNLYRKLAKNNALVNVPSSFYHDKSFAITQKRRNGEDALLSYGVGSAQFSEKSLNENIEMGVFFRGNQLLPINERHKRNFEDEVLEKLQSENMPVSKRYQQLAAVGSSPTSFLSEGLSNVDSQAIEDLKKNLESLKSFYGEDKVQIDKRYNIHSQDPKNHLSGLKVTVTDSLGNESISMNLTVKKDGNKQIVSISDRDINISGSVFVNRTNYNLDIYGRFGESKTLSPEKAMKLDSLDTATSMIGSMIRSLEDQSKFRIVDQVFERMEASEILNATESLLLRESNQTLSELGHSPVDSLKEVFQKLDEDFSSPENRAKFIDSLQDRLTAKGADPNIVEAQSHVLTPTLDNLAQKADYDLLSGKMVQSLASAMRIEKEGFAPLQNLKYRMLQESERGSQLYKILNKKATKELEGTYLDSFFGSHEAGGSAIQAMARLPVFGVEESDLEDVNKSRLFTVGQTESAPHAYLNPIGLKHGDLITTEDKPYGGEFFRPISSVAYKKRTGEQSLGGLRSVRTIDNDDNSRAASVYDFNTLMRGMPHLSMVTRGEIQEARKDINSLGVSIGSDIEDDFDREGREKEEDDFLFLMPFPMGKLAQTSQRIKNMIGTRPMKEVRTETVRKLYSGDQISPEEVSSDKFNVGEISSSLPKIQFEYVQQVMEEERKRIREKEGKDASIEKVHEATRLRLQRETLDDPGAFTRGFVNQSRPRLIALSMGASTMSDFSLNNPKYDASFSYRTNKSIQFNTTEVYDFNQTRASILEKLQVGTRIFGSQIELENPSSPFFRDIQERFKRSIEEGLSKSEAIRNIKSGLDNDLAPRLDISSPDSENLIFKLDKGAYQFDDRGKPSFVAPMNEEGYLIVGYKSRQTPSGPVTTPITFKDPSASERFEKGISVVSETTSGNEDKSTMKIDIALDTVKIPSSGLRGGDSNIKGGALYITEEFFNQISSAVFNQKTDMDVNPEKFLPDKVLDDEDKKRVSGKDIYGVYGAQSFKSFNFESGVYLLGDPKSRGYLYNMKGKDIALSLSYLFMGDVTSKDTPFAEKIASKLPERSPMRSALIAESEKIRDKLSKLDPSLSKVEKEEKVGGSFSARGEKSEFKNLELSLMGLLAFSPKSKDSPSSEKDIPIDPFHFKGLRGKEDLNRNLVNIRNLVEQALDGNETAQDTLKNRLQGLLGLLSDSNKGYGITLEQTDQGDRLSLNETSPIVRGASVFAFLATTGRSLLDPQFVDSEKAIYDSPDGRLTTSEGRRELAKDIKTVIEQGGKTNTLSLARKKNIEALVSYATEEDIGKVLKRHEGKGEKDKVDSIEELLFVTHTQLQNQIFVPQLVRNNPSQSLVATGMRDVGRLEYQYVQSYSKNMSQELLHEPSSEELDVRTAYAILSNIGRSSGLNLDSRDLRTASINTLAKDEIESRVNRMALSLPKLRVKGEPSLESQLSKKLLQISSEEDFNTLIEATNRLKSNIKGFRESFQEYSLDERIEGIKSTIDEVNQRLSQLNLDPIRISGIADSDLLNEIRTSYDEFSGDNFRSYLRQTKPNVYRKIEEYGITDLVYDEISGKPSIIQNPDQFNYEIKRRFEDLREGIRESLQDSEPSSILNSLRTVWRSAERLSEETGDENWKKYWRNTHQTRAITIPQIGFSDQGAYALNPKSAEPITLLMPGVGLLDQLKVEYPGFDDPLLKMTAELRELNYQLRDVDYRLAEAEQPLDLTQEEKRLIKRRESLAPKMREELQEVSSSIVKRSTGDQMEFPGTSFPAMRLFYLDHHEVGVGSRIDSIEPPISEIKDPRYENLVKALTRIKYGQESGKEDLSQEYDDIKEQKEDIKEKVSERVDYLKSEIDQINQILGEAKGYQELGDRYHDLYVRNKHTEKVYRDLGDRYHDTYEYYQNEKTLNRELGDRYHGRYVRHKARKETYKDLGDRYHDIYEYYQDKKKINEERGNFYHEIFLKEEEKFDEVRREGDEFHKLSVELDKEAKYHYEQGQIYHDITIQQRQRKKELEIERYYENLNAEGYYSYVNPDINERERSRDRLNHIDSLIRFFEESQLYYQRRRDYHQNLAPQKRQQQLEVAQERDSIRHHQKLLKKRKNEAAQTRQYYRDLQYKYGGWAEEYAERREKHRAVQKASKKREEEYGQTRKYHRDRQSRYGGWAQGYREGRQEHRAVQNASSESARRMGKIRDSARATQNYYKELSVKLKYLRDLQNSQKVSIQTRDNTEEDNTIRIQNPRISYQGSSETNEILREVKTNIIKELRQISFQKNLPSYIKDLRSLEQLSITQSEDNIHLGIDVGTPFVSQMRFRALDDRREEIEVEQAKLKARNTENMDSSRAEVEDSIKEKEGSIKERIEVYTREVYGQLKKEGKDASADEIGKLLDEVRDIHFLADQGQAYRGGAPHAIHKALKEGILMKDIVSTEAINQRADENNSLIKLAHDRAKTAMIMPGFGAHYTQQGDFDGDTYMLMLSKARHTLRKQTELLKRHKEKEAKLERLRSQVRATQAGSYRISGIQVSPEDLASNSLNIVGATDQDSESRHLHRKMDDLSEELRRERKEIEENEQVLGEIEEKQKERTRLREQDLKQSIRQWTHHYTGLPEFIFTDQGKSSLIGKEATALGYSESEEVFSEAQLSLFMNSMRSVSEMTTEAREGTQAVLQVKKAFDELNTDYANKEQLREKLDPSIFSRLESILKDNKETINREEASQHISKVFQTESSLPFMKKLLASASGSQTSDEIQEVLQGAIGTSGGQLLGEAYNAFVPMMHFASAQKAFQASIEEDKDYEELKNKYREALKRDNRYKTSKNSVDTDKVEESVSKVMREDKSNLFKELDSHFQSIFQLVSNAQVIVRDDALKPKGNEDIEQTISRYLQNDDIPKTPTNRGTNIKRQQSHADIVFSELGTPLNLDHTTNYTTGTLGAMRLASLYTGSDNQTLHETIEGHLKGKKTYSFISDALTLYNENHRTMSSEGEVVPQNEQQSLQMFEEAITEFSARTLASYQMNSNLDMGSQELNRMVERIYLKSLDSSKDSSDSQEQAIRVRDSIERKAFSRTDRNSDTSSKVEELRMKLEKDEDLSKQIVGKLIYDELTSGTKRDTFQRSLRHSRELILSQEKLKKSENLDQILADAYESAQSMTAVHSVNQRSQLESNQQHHTISLYSLRQVESWAKQAEQKGFDLSQVFRPDNIGTDSEAEAVAKARANLVHGLIAGSGLGRGDMDEVEKMKFTEAMFKGYSSDPNKDESHFGKMLNKAEGVEQQIKHIDSLISLEKQMEESGEYDPSEELEKKYQYHLDAMKDFIPKQGQTQSNLTQMMDEGRKSRSEWQRIKEETLRESDPEYKRAVDSQRQQVYEANRLKDISRGSEMFSSLATPAVLALMGSGIGENMDERTAFFAYDILQASSEMSVNNTDSSYSLQTQKHILGNEDMSVSAKAFRMQRVRMAMESQETMTQGFMGAIAQESSIKAFSNAIQGVSRRVNESVGRSRVGSNIASMSFELLGDSVMMGVSRLIGGVNPIQPKERDLPQQMVDYLIDFHNRIRKKGQAQQRAAAGVGEDDINTYVYNESVDFTANVEEGYRDDMERGVVVVDNEEDPVPIGEEA